MYKKSLFILLAFFMLSSFVRLGNNPPSGDCEIANTSFASGEKLVYKVYYNWQFIWIPAGEAVFNIKENRFDYEVKVTGRTYESYDNFFRVNDYFYSKIDKKNHVPKKFCAYHRRRRLQKI